MIGVTPLTRGRVLLAFVCHYAITVLPNIIVLFTASDAGDYSPLNALGDSYGVKFYLFMLVTNRKPLKGQFNFATKWH
jgi:hypothetical protein